MKLAAIKAGPRKSLHVYFNIPKHSLGRENICRRKDNEKRAISKRIYLYWNFEL